MSKPRRENSGRSSRSKLDYVSFQIGNASTAHEMIYGHGLLKFAHVNCNLDVFSFQPNKNTINASATDSIR